MGIELDLPAAHPLIGQEAVLESPSIARRGPEHRPCSDPGEHVRDPGDITPTGLPITQMEIPRAIFATERITPRTEASAMSPLSVRAAVSVTRGFASCAQTDENGVHMREGGDGLPQPSEGLGIITNGADALTGRGIDSSGSGE